MKTRLFKVECLTDMHVGSGEAGYSIIDNEVQKDTVLKDVPIIHASGVKGALREHFERIWGKDDEKVIKIFGGKDKENKKTIEGDYKFFNALCVARPLRVTNGGAPYVLATSQAVLDHLKSLLAGLGCEEAYNRLFGESPAEASAVDVEDRNDVPKKSCSFLGEFVVMNNLQDYELPVRARNVLDDDGLSKNLWYEELVPHKSIFFFAVLTSDDTYFDKFKEKLEAAVVQFGGNAGIGNGYTKITEVRAESEVCAE